jgi:hypothetical protein
MINDRNHRGQSWPQISHLQKRLQPLRACRKTVKLRLAAAAIIHDDEREEKSWSGPHP